MTTESQINGSEQEVTLKESIDNVKKWFFYLLSKWKTILMVGILGCAVGLACSFLKKPIYLATTTFVLEDDKQSGALGSLAGLASVAGVNLGTGGGGIFQGENILELYKSRTMIEKTLLTEVYYKGQKHLLIDRYIEFNKLKKDWEDEDDLKDLSFKIIPHKKYSPHYVRLKDSIMRLVVKDINKNYLSVVKPDKKLSIIRADMTSKDEYFAKAFNEEIVKNVNDFYVKTKTKKAKENVTILQQKTDSVRGVMNGEIYTLTRISDVTPNMNLTRQVKRIAPMQKSQFSAETNKAVLSELLKNLEMAKITLRKEAPLIQVVDVPVLPLEVNKLGKIKGIVFGGLLAGFLVLGVLIFQKLTL